MGKNRRHRKKRNAPNRTASGQVQPRGRISPTPRTIAVTAAGLVLAVVIVFAQSGDFNFVTYDDPAYVTENPMVMQGLTDEGLRWAFTSFHANNWHPLTWISHMVDCQLFGLDAGKHHLTNMALHAVAVVLLFVAFCRMTGSVWPSTLVAALFAIHPLRAESVAWVAERKDVLSVMLCMAVLLVWTWYVKRPGVGRYLVVAAVFALGLMAKPMLVTLPFVLLLLDLWPLHRFQLGEPSPDPGVAEVVRRRGLVLALEKLPLVVMALASSVVTVIAQRGALGGLPELPFTARLSNALVAWVAYVVKSVFPTNLAVFYPHPVNGTPWWLAAAAGAILIAVTAAVLRQIRPRPYLAVGWFWFLGTLLPVIGLVQVGSQAMADRYSYLPQIGLWLMLAWGLADLVTHRPQLRFAITTTLVVVLILFAALAWRQTATWANSETLYRQALEATENNWVAHTNYSEILIDSGRLNEAARHAKRSLELNPNHHAAAVLLGKSQMAMGRPEEALEAYKLARQLRPDLSLVLFNMGNAYRDLGDIEQALQAYREVLADDPDHIPARNNLGVELLRRQEPDAAAEVLCTPETARSPDLNIHFNCGLAQMGLRHFDLAIESFRRATTIDPGHAPSWRGLTFALMDSGRRDEAVQTLGRAMQLEPENPRNQQIEKLLESPESAGPVSDGENP